MIKDKYLRLLSIPLLGILIPFFSGIINYSKLLYTGTDSYKPVLYFAFILHLGGRELDSSQDPVYF